MTGALEVRELFAVGVLAAGEFAADVLMPGELTAGELMPGGNLRFVAMLVGRAGITNFVKTLGALLTNMH